MKKTIIILTLIFIALTLSSCKKEKAVEVCEGYKGLTGCIIPDFEVCVDDCNTNVNDVKYFSFQKSAAYARFVSSYFESLDSQNSLPENYEISFKKEDIINHKYSDNLEFYYQFLNELKDDFFGMSTNAELCNENELTNNCVLSQNSEQIISANYKMNETVFENSWEKEITSSEFNGKTKILIRGNKAFDDNSFEFFRYEVGDIESVQKNTYAFNVNGVMKVYSYSLSESSQKGYIYYMYDSNTGNYIKYTNDGIKYKLDYFIANHDKLYTIEKINNTNIEVYSVTYFDETQDYLSVRLIKQLGTFTAVNLSFNLKYIDGWDVADMSTDKILLEGEILNTSGYSLYSVVENIDGTSPFRIYRDFPIDDFDNVGLSLGGDLTFDAFSFTNVQSDINNIILNSNSYQTAFGIEFGNDINSHITDVITLMHQTIKD